MLRLIGIIAAAFALAFGLAWLADRPGSLVLNWQGYEVETSVFRAVVILTLLVGFSIFAWNLLRQLWLSPAIIGNLFNRRRQKRGLEALSTGMIALGAGDKQSAMRHAVQARRTLPNEPLTHLLRAQAAQLAGDKITARRIYEAMLSSPDTEQLGLRGLYLEAQSEGEIEAARQFAERALRVNPKLDWAAASLFELQCKQRDWDAALGTLGIARKHGHLDKPTADRRRAVLLTAQAQAAEDSDPERALALAAEANGLAPDLVPAAAIAGRVLASKGNTPRATKIIQTTWKKSPHPDLAVAYAYARIGDSPRDRLLRVKQLSMQAPMSIESPIALATAAIEAKDWDEARGALEPLVEGRLTQRVCTLMARIEGEQHGDKGRVREWLARALNAPRDEAWTADGIVSETWQPVSPVTGQLDAFEWRVPVQPAEKRDAGLLAEKLEELVALGAPSTKTVETTTPVLEARPVVAESTSRSTATAGAARRMAVEDVEPADAAPVPKPVTQTEIAAPPPDAAATTSATATKSGEERSTATSTPNGRSTSAEPAAADRAPTLSTTAARSQMMPEGGRAAASDSEVVITKVASPTRQANVSAGDSPVAAAARAAAASVSTAAVSSTESEPKQSMAQKVAASLRRDTTSGSPRKGDKPNIFVAPRAPDDPGPDKDEDRRRFRNAP